MFGFIFLTVFVCFIASFFISCQIKNEKSKIFGIYSQRNRWYYLKFIIMYVILSARKLKILFLGKNLIYPERDLEKLKPLSHHENAFDAVFFQAVSQDGIYLCGGTERRQQAKTNGLFYILVPEYGLLLSEKLPNTVLNTDPSTILTMGKYASEGITFTPIIPMKQWEVSYTGKMRLQNSNKTFKVKLQANWYSKDIPWFLFDVEIPSSVIASAIATEEWNESLFASLKKAHQTHYEQMGKLTGTLTIDKTDYSLKMDAFRDHSFGHKRDWTLMHRYIFHMLYLLDGTKICFGVVCQPCTTSHLEMGYIVKTNKKIQAITGSNLKLYQHGENGIPPKELGFSLYTTENEYDVHISYSVESIHFVGKNIEAKMHERFLTCTVNGVKGRGISEWHYNNTKNIDN